MLDTLKCSSKRLGHEIDRAFDRLSEGWHEMVSRSSNALTRFTRDIRQNESRRDIDIHSSSSSVAPAAAPHWSLLAGEVEETDKEVIVRVELPGLRKEDCTLTIEDNVLYLRGEKHAERASNSSRYHIMERAYGTFQRIIALPRNVQADQAEARFENGVMTVRLPKAGAGASHRYVPVS